MQIEEPFAVLPMTGYCKAIQKDVQEVLENTDGESRHLMCVACLHCSLFTGYLWVAGGHKLVARARSQPPVVPQAQTNGIEHVVIRTS